VVDEVRVIRLLRAASGALGQRGILDPGTADRMRMTVGLRNVLVHEYVGVDDAIVVARLADLSDLEEFIVQVSRWLSVPPETP
jgi:uncharacterized protein YutE (UPF0331/DUF86 family)